MIWPARPMLQPRSGGVAANASRVAAEGCCQGREHLDPSERSTLLAPAGRKVSQKNHSTKIADRSSILPPRLGLAVGGCNPGPGACAARLYPSAATRLMESRQPRSGAVLP